MRFVVYLGNILITGLAFGFIASLFVIDSSLSFGMKVLIELAVAAGGGAVGYRQAKKTEAVKPAGDASRASRGRSLDRRAPRLTRSGATRYLVYSIYIAGTGFVLSFLSLAVTNRLPIPTIARAFIQIGVIAGGGVLGYLQAKKNEEAKRVKVAQSSSETSPVE